MKLFEFSKALPDGDLQETRMEWKTCLHKTKPRFSRSSLSKTRTTVTLANYDMSQKGGRERPNEPAVPNHCSGFGTWMKGQDLTFQQPSHPHLLFQKAARSLILKKISSWTRNDPVIAQRTIPGGPSPTLHVAGQDWRQEASQWPLKRNVH